MSMSKLTRIIPIWANFSARICANRLQIRMSSNDSKKYIFNLVNENNQSRFSIVMTAALCGATLINLWLLNEDIKNNSIFNLKQMNLQAKEQSDNNSEVFFLVFFMLQIFCSKIKILTHRKY